MSKLQRIKTLVESGNFSQAKEELLEDSSPVLLSERQQGSRYLQQREINSDPFNSASDRGNGRVSDGLRFLELVSLFFTGKNVNSMLKFDTIPRYVNPVEFLQNNSEIRKVELMSKSLGIEEALDTVKTRDRGYYDSLVNILLEAYVDVENSTFRVVDNKTLLAVCRGLYRRVGV